MSIRFNVIREEHSRHRDIVRRVRLESQSHFRPKRLCLSIMIMILSDIQSNLIKRRRDLLGAKGLQRTFPTYLFLFPFPPSFLLLLLLPLSTTCNFNWFAKNCFYVPDAELKYHEVGMWQPQSCIFKWGILKLQTMLEIPYH